MIGNALGWFPPHCPPPVESTLSLFCNLSEIATKMLDTFTCKSAEKHKAREWIVNEILWLSKVLWNDQVANNSKRDHIKCLAATALVTVINAEGSRYEQNLHFMLLLCMYVEYTEAIFSIILVKYCSKPILAVFPLSKTLYRQHPYVQVYTKRLEKESPSIHKYQITAENKKMVTLIE